MNTDKSTTAIDHSITDPNAVTALPVGRIEFIDRRPKEFSAPSTLEYSAWLIEAPYAGGYWDGKGYRTFSSNIDHAVRFARQEDAQRVITLLYHPNEGFHAEAHLWL